MDTLDAPVMGTPTRLFVGNLAWEVTDEDLGNHFGQYGALVSWNVVRDSSGRSRGYGLVEFANPMDAQLAMQSSNDFEFFGRPMNVREDREAPGAVGARPPRAAEPAPARTVVAGRAPRGPRSQVVYKAGPPGCSVYVGNLPWSVSWQDLKDFMRAAGEVTHSEVLREGGRSKGCGIVQYSTPEEAQKAIATLNGAELLGRPIVVREDREEEKFKQGGSVFVGNLSWNTSWQDLKDFMRAAGEVLHADVFRDRDGRSKGSGIVRFADPESAQKAINELNNAMLKDRQIIVREDREA